MHANHLITGQNSKCCQTLTARRLKGLTGKVSVGTGSVHPITVPQSSRVPRRPPALVADSERARAPAAPSLRVRALNDVADN